MLFCQVCDKTVNFENEFGIDVFTTDGSVLFCQVCDKTVNFENEFGIVVFTTDGSVLLCQVCDKAVILEKKKKKKSLECGMKERDSSKFHTSCLLNQVNDTVGDRNHTRNFIQHQRL